MRLLSNVHVKGKPAVFCQIVRYAGSLITLFTDLVLLTMILFRKQIRNMLGGETGKTTFGRIKHNLGLRAKEFRFVYNKLVQGAGVDLRLSV